MHAAFRVVAAGCCAHTRAAARCSGHRRNHRGPGLEWRRGWRVEGGGWWVVVVEGGRAGGTRLGEWTAPASCGRERVAYHDGDRGCLRWRRWRRRWPLGETGGEWLSRPWPLVLSQKCINGAHHTYAPAARCLCPSSTPRPHVRDTSHADRQAAAASRPLPSRTRHPHLHPHPHPSLPSPPLSRVRLRSPPSRACWSAREHLPFQASIHLPHLVCADQLQSPSRCIRRRRRPSFAPLHHSPRYRSHLQPPRRCELPAHIAHLSPRNPPRLALRRNRPISQVPALLLHRNPQPLFPRWLLPRPSL